MEVVHSKEGLGEGSMSIGWPVSRWPPGRHQLNPGLTCHPSFTCHSV